MTSLISIPEQSTWNEIHKSLEILTCDLHTSNHPNHVQYISLSSNGWKIPLVKKYPIKMFYFKYIFSSLFFTYNMKAITCMHK